MQNSYPKISSLHLDLFDHLSDAVIYTDTSLTTLYSNAKAKQLFKPIVGQLTGLDATSLFTTVPGTKQNFDVNFSQQPVLTTEGWFRCPDGCQKFLETKVTAIKDGTEPIGYLWIAREKKQFFVQPSGNLELRLPMRNPLENIEQSSELDKLKYTAHIQRLAISSLASAFLLVDLDFRLILINKAGEDLTKRLFGQTITVGENFMDWLKIKDKKTLTRRFRHVLAGTEERMEYHCRHGNEYIWLEVIFRPVYDDMQQVIGLDIIGRDITAEKLAKQKLSDSEKRFRALFNSSHQFTALLDVNGNILEINDTIIRFSGLRPTDLVNKKIWNCSFWASSENTRYNLQTAVHQATKGESIRFEAAVTGIEGASSIIDFSVRPIVDDYGTITMLIAEGQRLDKQKKLEQELQERERQLTTFMENIPTYAWITDENHILRYMNPVLLRIYGFPEDAIGRSLRDLFPPDLAEGYIRNDKRVFAENTVVISRDQALNLRGEMETMQVFKFPLGTDRNGVKLLGGVGMDITAIVKTKEELRASIERFELASKATSEVIWDWNIITNKLSLGQSSAKPFGSINMEKSMDGHIVHVHPKDRQRYQDSMKAAIEGKTTSWSAEYRFKSSSGRYKIVLDKAYILRDNEKKAIRMIGAMQDVTKQRKLERRLLQEVVTRKREMIRTAINAQEKERKEISNELHDNVNQLLATCNLYIDVIKSQKTFTLIDDCKDILKQAMMEIRNLSHSLTPAAFAEKGLYRTITEMAKRINDSGTLNVALDIEDIETMDEVMPPELKTAIYRIIQEQMNNTLKHAQAKQVLIGLHHAGQKLMLSIIDNGRGFNIAELKRGLGLNNIQSRISLFDGTMALYSSPGKGCSLRAEIPIDQKNVA